MEGKPHYLRLELCAAAVLLSAAPGWEVSPSRLTGRAGTAFPCAERTGGGFMASRYQSLLTSPEMGVAGSGLGCLRRHPCRCDWTVGARAMAVIRPGQWWGRPSPPLAADAARQGRRSLGGRVELRSAWHALAVPSRCAAQLADRSRAGSGFGWVQREERRRGGGLGCLNEGFLSPPVYWGTGCRGGPLHSAECRSAVCQPGLALGVGRASICPRRWGLTVS